MQSTLDGRGAYLQLHRLYYQRSTNTAIIPEQNPVHERPKAHSNRTQGRSPLRCRGLLNAPVRIMVTMETKAPLVMGPMSSALDSTRVTGNGYHGCFDKEVPFFWASNGNPTAFPPLSSLISEEGQRSGVFECCRGPIAVFSMAEKIYVQ